MKIPFTEPTAPRYIYINPETNKVHVLMPVVSGSEIGLDNTCKSVFAVQEFFGKSRDVRQRAALDELVAYQNALEFDISLIDADSELKAKKQERLAQIKNYRAALEAMQKSPVLADLGKALPTYPEPLQKMMGSKESNLHSMVLRPKEMDNFLRSLYPVFSLKREGVGVFYGALSEAYKEIGAIPGAREQVIATVLASDAGQRNHFEGLQRELTESIEQQLGIRVDFTQTSAGLAVTKSFIDTSMNTLETAKDTIESLLGYCASDLFDTLNESPFRSIRSPEELSIITQFFLANVNIYCRTQNISSTNFGTILDGSEELSNEVVGIVLSCTLSGSSIEEALFEFIHTHQMEFGLNRPLTPADSGLIKKKFTEYFTQIKDSPHFDEFSVLDESKPGPFLRHQGAICLNLAQLACIGFPEINPEFFAGVCADFGPQLTALHGTIPHNNPWVHADIELSIEQLLHHIHDEEQLDTLLKKLPPEQRAELMASPILQRLQVPKFLHCVARGQQNEAQQLLEANAEAHFLLQTDSFTDYSGRTFNCTAYEYAYWAKDTHMCRMLERYMDEETKAAMLLRCETIEREGLAYTQHGEPKNSKHFDFSPLKTALKHYVDGYNAWYAQKSNWPEMKAAWLCVGKAQRDVPAHVAQEYCRPDRSFDPTPRFNEAELPRNGTYYNWITERDERWFPVADSDSEGLGVNFALYGGEGARAGGRGGGRGCSWHRCVLQPALDLAAVSRLDEVRSHDLTRSREHLRPTDLEHVRSFLIS